MGDSEAPPRRLRVALLVGALVLAALAPRLLTERSNAGVEPRGCGARDSAGLGRATLPHVAARIAAGEPLVIVAFGSSSTAGAGASRPESSYPSQLRTELTARLGDGKVTVINRGVGGEGVAAMARRIERDVVAEHPDLAIWQLGTNDVLHEIDPAGDHALIRSGIARLKEGGMDVILMSPQYAPAVLAHPGYRDMLHAISAAGFAEGVPVFHRFEVMRAWDDQGVLPMSEAISGDRLHMNDRSYGCLAHALAEGIVAAAR